MQTAVAHLEGDARGRQRRETDRSAAFHSRPPQKPSISVTGSQTLVQSLPQQCLSMTLEGGDLAEVSISSQHLVHLPVELHEVKKDKIPFISVYKKRQDLPRQATHVRAAFHRGENVLRCLTSKEE